MIKREQGFTLIELLIVIIILGILAVVGIPKFMNSQADAWASTCKTNRATLEDAGERYQFDKAAYPAAQADLTGGGYIKRTFLCPADQTNADPYNFAADGTVTCDLGPAPGSAKHK